MEAARAVHPDKMTHDFQLQDMVAVGELDGDDNCALANAPENTRSAIK